MNPVMKTQHLLRQLLDCPGLMIETSTRLASLPRMDSVAMIQLVLALEAEFQVEFTTQEVADIKQVGDILRHIEAHRPGVWNETH